MTFDIQRVEYYTITVEGHITSASKLLSTLAGAGVDFHAFKAVPVKPDRTQFTLFAKNSSTMTEGARKSGLNLEGPYDALLIKGDEESGALADIYKKLSLAGIQVDEACGIADIHDGYGVILYLENEACDKAVAALEM